MKIQGAVALVTGANRGLGAEFAQALLDNGAAKVYAGARNPSSITDPRLTPIRLDVTDKESIAAAAAIAPDVNILINNAGIGTRTEIIGDPKDLRDLLEVNLYGLIDVTRAFAPILAANGGGAVVNMLSVASWRQALLGAYGVSKTAAWGASNAMRVQLAPQGTLVVGVHAGFLETDMADGVTAPKTHPRVVADETMKGLLNDEWEVYGDEVSQVIKSQLSAPLEEMYRDFMPAKA
ncbi:SDR family oxidoreductase [Actinocrispum sp. NPDC049592]|uniref:SDR family oxidoreductase n=1 Tax=Actinocrispum sp. NPDC049592 TaxID=3154835 RepID=UPI00342F0486